MRRGRSNGTAKTGSKKYMVTRKNINKIARVSVMPDSQNRRNYDLPELQRNVLSKHILQNIIKNNTEPNQTVLKGNNRISGRIHARESTIYQTHTIKPIVKKSHEFDMDIYLLFVDFGKKYDSINRYRLWKAMVQLEIPAKLMKLVKTCIQHSKCKVKFNAELLLETDLRQRNALSPTLFNIALESVVR